MASGDCNQNVSGLRNACKTVGARYIYVSRLVIPPGLLWVETCLAALLYALGGDILDLDKQSLSMVWTTWKSWVHTLHLFLYLGT